MIKRETSSGWAERLLITGADANPGLRSEHITHWARIHNPDANPGIPAWYQGHRLTIALADVASRADAIARSTRAPESTDVAAFLTFARAAWAAPASRLLVQCDYGASRSPAMALLAVADQMGAGLEQEALGIVLGLRPPAIPNRRIVALGDAHLRRQGRLIEAVERHFAALRSVLDFG
jgi:predicted protein tyrosine phosphatase